MAVRPAHHLRKQQSEVALCVSPCSRQATKPACFVWAVRSVSRANVKPVRNQLKPKPGGFTIQSPALQRWLKAVISAVLTSLIALSALAHMGRKKQSHAATPAVHLKKPHFSDTRAVEGNSPLTMLTCECNVSKVRDILECHVYLTLYFLSPSSVATREVCT